MRSTLIGYTGFVGGTLARSRQFSELYNSKNIREIAGRSCDLLICAAAPATMWAANQNPQADKDNLENLLQAVKQAKVGAFVLVSTIAVFDNAAARYTESNANYETGKAYGRHRRELEIAVSEYFPRAHILRLPALFGAGIKKNFLFDLINPSPSFIKPEIWEKTIAALKSDDGDILRRFYSLDAGINMWKLDRIRLNKSGGQIAVDGLFERLGMAARNFTNSKSRFQFYNLARLSADIDKVVEAGLDVINLCSQPLEAGEVCRALTGREFFNEAPPLVSEDMRSNHVALFGGVGPYLFDRDSVLADLKAFFAEQTA